VLGEQEVILHEFDRATGSYIARLNIPECSSIKSIAINSTRGSVIIAGNLEDRRSGFWEYIDKSPVFLGALASPDIAQIGRHGDIAIFRSGVVSNIPGIPSLVS
jgi:hypothetical protein